MLAMIAIAPALAAPDINVGGELLRVILSLGGIIVLILLAGWFSRRVQARGTPGGRRIRCLETFAVGTRDRLMLLEVDGKRLLIGAGTGGMHTLHVYDHADAVVAAPATPAAAARSPFSELLSRLKGTP